MDVLFTTDLFPEIVIHGQSRAIKIPLQCCEAANASLAAIHGPSDSGSKSQTKERGGKPMYARRVSGAYTVPASRGCASVARRFMHRIVTEEVGESIFKFKDKEHLFKILLDVVEIHEGASSHSNVMHRAISSGNVLIHDGRGYLSDWDTAASHKDTSAMESSRVGSCEFMSIRLSTCNNANVEIRDDMESVFWLLLWVLLHRFPLKDQSKLQAIRSALFEPQYSLSKFGGGGGKWMFIRGYRGIGEYFDFDNKPLDGVVYHTKRIIEASVQYDNELAWVDYSQTDINSFVPASMRDLPRKPPELPFLQYYDSVRRFLRKCAAIFKEEVPTGESEPSLEHPPTNTAQEDPVNEPEVVEVDDGPSPSKKRKTARAGSASFPPRRSKRKCVLTRKLKYSA